MKKSSVVRSDPDILGGTPVFVGTRVRVQALIQALIDYIEGGHSLKECLDAFPTGHAGACCCCARAGEERLIADARAA